MPLCTAPPYFLQDPRFIFTPSSSPQLVHFTFVTDRCARGPTVVGPAALEAINLSAALPYVVELHEARQDCV